MKTKYDLVVFDVDGTLLDTTEGVVASVRHTIREFGLKEQPEEVLSTFIGPPIQDSFARVYGFHGDILQRLATVFRDQYKTKDLLKAEPYQGIYEVFDGLKDRGIATAVATYKRDDYANTIVRHFGFQQYTDIIFGADHENKLKKKDIIEKCIRTGGNPEKSKVVMVGDTLNDAIGAREIGIDFIAVTYGFGFHEPGEFEEISKVGVAEKPLDLLKIIDELGEGK